MPPSRNLHQRLQQQQQQQHREQHSPPPYDGRRVGSMSASRGRLTLDCDPELVSAVFERVSQQTVPKTRDLQLKESRRRSLEFAANEEFGAGPRKRQNRPESLNDRPEAATSAPRARHEPTGGSSSGGERRDSNSKFVSSLAASKWSCLRHITIEPLAFLAIMALYLEFPAIQDLIYTKVCLEVVGRQPDMLVRPGQVPLRANASDHSMGDPLNSTLASSGRIQQLATGLENGSAQVAPLSANEASATVQPDLHAICDRLNRTAVPRAIRQQITDENSLFWLKYEILVCLLSALCSPYWGGVSDRIGRVLPLNVPIAASVLCNAISLAFGLLISLDSHALVQIEWLYAGALLVGLSGGQSVLIMNAFSFVSDNTSSEERSKRVAVLESVIFVGHSSGFLLGRLIMPLGLAGPAHFWLNRHVVAFSACILLNLLCALYSACRLRHIKFHRFLNNFEREQQEAASAAAANLGANNLAASTATLALDAADLQAAGGACRVPCERLRELTSSTPDDPDGPIARSDKSNWSARDTLITFRYYRETYETARKPREARASILLLLLLGFLSALSLATLMSLLFLYVKMDPFNWPTSQYSSWNANSSIARGLALIGLTLMMRFLPGWRLPDTLVAGLGFAGKGAGLLMIGLARSNSLLEWSLAPLAVSEFSMPPIRSLLSKLVLREELCKIYACLGALQSLCFILGNLAFYLAYSSFVRRDLFRLAFVVVGAVELAALLLVLLVHATIKRRILVS